MIQTAIEKIQAKSDLTMEEMTQVIDAIMHGEVEAETIATLLLALREKGEAVSEIAGAAAAMRKNMTPIRTRRTGLIDTCGTGGDGSKTFNISTAAAIVTAAAGVPVAKHGNRGISSKSGSADVLAELGVNVEASIEQVEACLDRVGICFCFAPLLHQSMRHVGPVRKKLGVPTIFNWLGPLCNPASAEFQLLGVGKPEMRQPMAEALNMLGAHRACVVSGEDGLDEVTLDGATNVTETKNGELSQFQWKPADFGLPPSDKQSMLIEGPSDSAAIIRQVLAGEGGPCRDIVVINAAAAILVADKTNSPEAAAQLAAETIDTGAARDLLARLAEVSHA